MKVPTNEQGVIVYFSANIHLTVWEIEHIRTKFPDAILKNTVDGEEWRAEFEYRASNFTSHGHSFKSCDLIICWINDLPESPIPILALSEDGWQDKRFKKIDNYDSPLDYWMERALKAERTLAAIDEKIGLRVPSLPKTKNEVTYDALIGEVRGAIAAGKLMSLNEISRINVAMGGRTVGRKIARHVLIEARKQVGELEKP